MKSQKIFNCEVRSPYLEASIEKMPERKLTQWLRSIRALHEKQVKDKLNDLYPKAKYYNSLRRGGRERQKIAE